MKAMILSAGTGTRLLPLTNNVPKALIKVLNRSLLEYCILYLKHYGIREIIINVHHYPDQIINFLSVNKNFGIHIEISDESERLLDTGGGLVKAKWFFKGNEPFFLLAVDVITSLNLTEMYKYHIENESIITLAVKDRKTSRNLLFDKDYNLCGWRNNTTCEVKKVNERDEKYSLAFSGIHLINPVIFQKIKHNEPFSIIDLYLHLAADFKIKGFRHDETDWFEFGRLENVKSSKENTRLKKVIQSFVKN